MSEPTNGSNQPLDDAPAGADADMLRLVHETAVESIVFVHVFPPRFDETALTFFGGLPIVSSGFEWPRAAQWHPPMSFLAQVDCAALPDIGLRYALPAGGILYFFVDWEGEPKGQVKYAPGPTTSFREATPPADLPPMLGDGAKYHYRWLEHTDRARRDYPTTSPKIAMRPDKLSTFAKGHPTERDGNAADRYKVLRQQEQAAATHRVYGPPADRAGIFTMRHGDSLWRPFPAFPHAWLAVEMVCGELLFALNKSRQDVKRGMVGKGEKWPKDPIALLQGYDRVAEEAAGWIATARDEGLMTGLPEEHKMAFWAWLEGLDAAVGSDTTDRTYDARSKHMLNRCILVTVAQACDECVMFSAASAALVPLDVVNELRVRHSPDGNSGDHRMLGRGVNLQGATECMGSTHELLMQLDTDAGLNWMIGDCGTIQYWITLEDLQAMRFDRVEVTMEDIA